MTKDDILSMAHEVGFNHPRLEEDTDYYKLERFTDLVAKNVRESMLQLFTDPENQPTQYGTVTIEYMQDKIVDERKACAKVGWLEAGVDCDDQVLAAILARGKP
jgi:hypothetical protein